MLSSRHRLTIRKRIELCYWAWHGLAVMISRTTYRFAFKRWNFLRRPLPLAGGAREGGDVRFEASFDAPFPTLPARGRESTEQASKSSTVCELVLALVAMLFPIMALAAPGDPPVLLQAASCPATATIPTRNYPGAEAIPTINAMAQPTGKAVAAEGQKLWLVGRVLDSACVPVLDASVELWQNDPYGRWILANGEDLANPNPVFTGAGRTYTKNNGEFHFSTLFPAPTANRAPNVNIKIKAHGLQDFSTVLYFAGDDRNMVDPMLRRLPPFAQESVSIAVSEGDNGVLVGRIDIVLPGKIKYRKY